jgi:hypothetical protein
MNTQPLRFDPTALRDAYLALLPELAEYDRYVDAGLDRLIDAIQGEDVNRTLERLCTCKEG